MLSFLFYIVLGAAGGHLFAVVARRTDPSARLFAHALLVAAFVYVAFAMASMESAWLAVEIVGFLIFLGFAALGLKRTLSWLWIGWAVHILWDGVIHLIAETPFVPAWYPAVCIGFDAVVAYHVFRMQGRTERPAGAPA